MTPEHPVLRREAVAWGLLVIALAAVGYLGFENYYLRLAVEANLKRDLQSALSQALPMALGAAESVTQAAPTVPKTPSPWMPPAEKLYPADGATLHVDIVMDGGRHLKFDDGSIWDASGFPNESTAAKWKKGQSVTFVNKYGYGKDYKLLNMEATTSVEAKWLLLPKPDAAVEKAERKAE